MRILFCFSCLLFSLNLYSQEGQNARQTLSFTPEILLGITGESNDGFPDRSLQKQVVFNLGWLKETDAHYWSKYLKITKSGFSLGYTDFGNTDELGYAISGLSFLEFKAFKSDRFKIHIGTGLSYFNKQFDLETNPNNKAVSTDMTWSFRMFSYYDLHYSNNIFYKVGLGYMHHSNGHSRLPNQGYNSFLVSFAADINKVTSKTVAEDISPKDNEYKRYNYFAIRAGIGENALSRSFNDKKPVYTFSLEYGRVYNRIFKVGIGAYYRFYQHYYDYINNNESLVQDGREFQELRNNPSWNASNLGISVNGELILNHIGIDVQFGFNIHKPAYDIDWRINEGWEVVPQVIPEESNIVLGELDTYFRIKKLISARFGLKYYLVNTKKLPKQNVYIGTFINANLGQADFTEIAIGYVHNIFN